MVDFVCVCVSVCLSACLSPSPTRSSVFSCHRFYPKHLNIVMGVNWGLDIVLITIQQGSRAMTGLSQIDSACSVLCVWCLV